MQTDPTRSGLFTLAILSIIGGACAGLVCGLFRVALEAADQFRLALPAMWGADPLKGFLLIAGCAAAATALSAFMVRRFSPEAAGSGIPHVESVLAAQMPPAPFSLVPIKFFGGLLAIGSGLALGREGPCVQMGATIAYFVGARRDWPDRQALLAAGAGAGLAAAFNAPFAGAAFVLEELLRRFETRNAIAALGASMSAIVVARLFTGAAPDFAIPHLPYPSAGDNLLCLGLGLFAGVLGAIYNRVLLDALDIADSLKRVPVELRAGSRRRGRRRAGVVRAGARRRRRRHDAKSSPWRAALRPAAVALHHQAVPELRLLCGGHARRPVRAAAAAWRADGLFLRRAVLSGRERPQCPCDPVRRRRHGGFVLGGGARAADRHDPRNRNDRKLDRASADARGVFHGDGAGDAARRRADL